MWPAMFSLALRARAAGLSAQWVRGWGGPGHCRHHRPLFVPPLALVPGDLPRPPDPPRALDGSAGGGWDAAAFVLAAAGMLRSCRCDRVRAVPTRAGNVTPNLVKVREAVVV